MTEAAARDPAWVVSRLAVVGEAADRLWWECEGCGAAHCVEVSGARRWEWDGSMTAPTISPSILVRFPRGDEDVVCHSFVRAGVVEFLGDCTHALAGRSVPMRPENADPFAPAAEATP